MAKQGYYYYRFYECTAKYIYMQLFILYDVHALSVKKVLTFLNYASAIACINVFHYSFVKSNITTKQRNMSQLFIQSKILLEKLKLQLSTVFEVFSVSVFEVFISPPTLLDSCANP